MNKRFFLTISCLSLALLSCSKTPSSSSASSSVPSSEASSSLSPSTSVSSSVKKAASIKIASFNDLHGAIEENGYEPGLSKLSSYLKSNYVKDDVLLANGDMWQGNGESNLNEGKLITEWMNLNEFSAMGLGNHDFDWGQEAIKANREVADFPFLDTNVYHYENGTRGSHADELGDSSTIFYSGGYKIGVVGGIGVNQYTSICSALVDNLDFADPYESLFKDESDKLRGEGCDLVIAEIHTSVSRNAGAIELTEDSPTYGKPYFDVIFGGHSHTKSVSIENGVPILMGKANGQQISEAVFTLASDSSLTLTSYGVNTIYVSSLTEDAETETLLDSYREDQDPILDEKVGNNGVGFTIESTVDEDTLGNMNAKAMYEVAKAVDPTVQITINNGGRNELLAGELTFRGIYRSFPFDNVIVLMDISALDLSRETSSSPFYNPLGLSAPDTSSSTTYRVAVIDYMALHQNAYHEFDYFPSKQNETIMSEDYALPRNIVRSFLNSETEFGDYTGAEYQYA